MPTTPFKKPAGPPSGSVIVLTFFFIVALFGTWGGMLIDGSFYKLHEAAHSEKPYILPGTDSEILSSITGVAPVDYLLKLLIVFFWEICDGSHPAASVEGIYFLSQFVAVITVLHFDRHRAANHEIGVISPTLWITVFQTITFACGGPVWALVYLSSTPLIAISNVTELRKAAAVSSNVAVMLPISTALGYTVPAIIMMIKSPTHVSVQFQQKAILFWNVFPLWIKGLKMLLAVLFKAKQPKSSTRVQTSLVTQTHLRTARVTYSMALYCTLGAHAMFFGLMGSSLLFPTIFAPGYVQEFTPASLYLVPFVRTPASTVGDTTLGFLAWDLKTGFSIMLCVALWQLNAVYKARGSSLRPIFAVLVTLLCIFFTGPGSALLIVSWLKDELLFENVDLNDASSTSWQQSLISKVVSREVGVKKIA